jgi:putative tricarboxylic transport membrane protein
MARYLNSTLLSGMILTGLGLLGIFVLVPLGIDPPYTAVQFEALSPAYWPRIVCYAITLIGVALVVSGFLSAQGSDAVADGQAAPGSDPRSPDAWRIVKPFAALAICFGLYATLDVLGFVLGCMIALAALMLLAGERRPHILLSTAICTPLVLHLFFTKAASVPIPPGLLEPLLARL